MSLEAEQELDELRRMMAAFDEQLRLERVRNETFRNRLNQQEAQIRELQKTTRGILESRIWRTLARMDQQLLRWSKSPAAGDRVEAVQLCMEHPADWSGAVAGKIRVKGWAVAQSGIMSVNVRVDEGEPAQARIGLPRKDVQSVFHRYHGSMNSGFQALVDLAGLSDGPHSLRIEVLSNQGTPAGQTFPIQVRNVEAAQAAKAVPDGPLISVVLNGSGSDSKWLRRSIESVAAQQYSNWELCGALGAYAEMDRRIKPVVEAGLQAAFKAAGGEYIAVLDQDDELAADALLESAAALRAHPEADLVYSDEDRIDQDGVCADALHKKPWAADPLTCLYAGRLGVYRASLTREVAGEPDFLLRIAARATHGFHIPKVLYHCRDVDPPPAGAQRAAGDYLIRVARQCKSVLEAARA